MKRYDVVVVGGGHAGVEAAAATARLGAKTLLVTMKFDNLGTMSCNPAIGGIGKGTIVKEIDALDGIMPRAIDASSINSQILNKSKGAAVWGYRAQADRKLYKEAVQSIISNYKNLEIIEGVAENITTKGNKISGLELKNKDKIFCKALVITTGTFLQGLIHQGEYREEAGRIGEDSSILFSSSLGNIGIKLGRLKTGTPARIYKDSINYSGLEAQNGDLVPVPFSALTKEILTPQIPCYITYTNLKTHEIIGKSMDKSPAHNGQVAARGVRYCPSIEEKVKRFNERERHQVFLEPEGLDSELIYPNGISTALPVNLQEEFIRTIPGLERCKIAQFGYAIEYNYLDARILQKTLAIKGFDGIFAAGQINGTTGYEEAASQGVIAGINAALFALNKGQEFILDRASSYIGVMINDLTTLGVNGEPYRMFTSRCEYRLSVRHDNADIRLTEIGNKIGCISEERLKQFYIRLEEIQKLKLILQNLNISPAKLQNYNVKISQDGLVRNGFELLSNKNINFTQIEKILPEIKEFSKESKFYIDVEAKYHFYIKRQTEEIENMRKYENIIIPSDIEYNQIKSLSNEAIEKLSSIRPEDIMSAKQISGVTPAAIMAILIYIKGHKA